MQRQFVRIDSSLNWAMCVDLPCSNSENRLPIDDASLGFFIFVASNELLFSHLGKLAVRLFTVGLFYYGKYSVDTREQADYRFHHDQHLASAVVPTTLIVFCLRKPRKVGHSSMNKSSRTETRHRNTIHDACSRIEFAESECPNVMTASSLR